VHDRIEETFGVMSYVLKAISRGLARRSGRPGSWLAWMPRRRLKNKGHVNHSSMFPDIKNANINFQSIPLHNYGFSGIKPTTMVTLATLMFTTNENFQRTQNVVKCV
jgi:hypothetical protein